MDPTASIRKLGFRRWYERQLIESHAALVTCLLCGITSAALLEVINLSSLDSGNLAQIGILFAAGLLGWLSWRRYITVLERAERYGQRSNCPKCAAYGRFKVIATGMDREPGPAALAVAPLDAAWMRVECRQCGSVWTMPE